MENNVEQEICNNCKKVIPQPNYVMHTMHCARNITLCQVCKEPVPKGQFPDHEKTCRKPVQPKPLPIATTVERSSYYQSRKAIEDKKTEARKERYMQKMERLVDSGHTLRENASGGSFGDYNRQSSNSHGRDIYGREVKRENSLDSSYRSRSSSTYSSSNAGDTKENGLPSRKKTEVPKEEKAEEKPAVPVPPLIKRSEPKSSGMLACKYCDLELPKLELEEHENYCGTRTDKCLECGELVMFKDKQVHMDSTHGGARRRGGQRTGWDSSSERNDSSSGTRERPSRAIRPLEGFDYDPMPYLPAAYQAPRGGAKKKEGESYKEISRRLDCKTEYIRNILHDSAAITVPLRRAGTAPRNYFFHHEKDSAPPVSSYRRRNPPTELVIPCEFCNIPIPHEDLVQHETGCRPDLARYNPRRRTSPEDDYYVEPQATADEEDLPCEFCGDMIPASQLYSHQIRCT